jgi:hypothetical protein
MKEFSKYLKEARQEFCKEVNKYNVSDNLKLRTACDSFLIAFDQATEKAINYSQCCESDSEQLTCDNCKHNCLVWDDDHPCATCAEMDNYVAR